MKFDAMLTPTPSKDNIIGKRSFSETIEIEDEDRDSIKRLRLDSSEDKKINIK